MIQIILTIICLSWFSLTYASDITVEEWKSYPKTLTLLDVRTPREFRAGHLPNALNINAYDPNLKKLLSKLNKSENYLIYCHSGHRSNAVVGLLKKLGFENVFNLKGGIEALKSKKVKLVK
ncbi:MAG: rhodanese-like domain-containing protein [Epsilonproteobacteria bacterium]|nr:MAG: rhodanese-like domain-containing protein [Campylobacterota bacterium]RLA65801.1 MAG: rhodanese-like domain-containing protein [Campylobacterota bacterium]